MPWPKQWRRQVKQMVGSPPPDVMRAADIMIDHLECVDAQAPVGGVKAVRDDKGTVVKVTCPQHGDIDVSLEDLA